MELYGPGMMSFTIEVPAAVPSLAQSSRPLVPSLAPKKILLPSTEISVPL